MIECHTYTEAGGHPENEDALLARELSAHPGTWICGLADGQGGQFGGAAAAARAVEAVGETAERQPPRRLEDARTWCALLSSADAAVEEEREAGFTTLVGLCLAPGRVAGASCGDSACLLVAGGRAEVLTERQRKNPPVGSGAAYPVPFSARLAGEWKVLVVSDGVWKYVGWDRVAEVVRAHHGEEAIASLREAAIAASGGRLSDDFTVALFEGGGEGQVLSRSREDAADAESRRSLALRDGP